MFIYVLQNNFSLKYAPHEMQRSMPGNKSYGVLFVATLFKFTIGKPCFKYF